MVSPKSATARAFRDFAGEATNTFDAHSLGALGARNLMGMGFVRARVRLFGRPVLCLGWTEMARNMCMVSDEQLADRLYNVACFFLIDRVLALSPSTLASSFRGCVRGRWAIPSAGLSSRSSWTRHV